MNTPVDPADKSEFTDEELAEAYRRGMEQIRAGQCVRVSMEELKKIANEQEPEA